MCNPVCGSTMMINYGKFAGAIGKGKSENMKVNGFDLFKNHGKVSDSILISQEGTPI